eukprot:jgi/Mesvir1/20557/Mv06234-RA.1
MAGEVDPTLEFTLADFPTAESFMAAQCGERMAWAFRMLVPGAYKADIYRLCVLYAGGGYYADLGTQLRAPVDSFVPANASFVIAIDPGWPARHNLWNGFIGSVPRHPILLEAMQAIVAHVEGCWYRDKDTRAGPLAVTGPELLGHVVRRLYGLPLRLVPSWNATNGLLLLPADKDAGNLIHLWDLGRTREVLKDKFPGQQGEFQKMGYLVLGAESYDYLWNLRKIYSPLLKCAKATGTRSVRAMHRNVRGIESGRTG